MATRRAPKAILNELGEALEKQMEQISIDPRNPQQVRQFIDGLQLPALLTVMISEEQDRE